MALRIIKARDPIKVERINLCIYAPPGVGKTSTAFSAEEPLCLDFDHGAYRATNRKDIVQISSWSEASELSANDLKPYQTIIVDTAGRCLDYLAADIVATNPKAGTADNLTLKGFGILKGRFSAWLRMINTFGKDVILVAHMDEQRSGDNIVERLDVQGGSKGEIYKSVDCMGRIFIRGQERVIDFSPRENAFGKNPTNMEVMVIPHPSVNNHFLADVIGDIKKKLNQLSAEQQFEQRAIEEWSAAVESMTTPQDYNSLLDSIKKAPKAAQAIFASSAKRLGFVFDQNSKLYKESESLRA